MKKLLIQAERAIMGFSIIDGKFEFGDATCTNIPRMIWIRCYDQHPYHA